MERKEFSLTFTVLILSCILCFSIGVHTFAAQVDPDVLEPDVVYTPVPISLNKTSVVCQITDYQQLVATVDSPYTPNYFWISSDPSIVSVSMTGRITAHQAGSATITVYSGIDAQGNHIPQYTQSSSASCTVNVRPLDGYYYIKGSTTGYCLDVEHASYNDFSNVYMYSKASTSAENHDRLCQIWKITSIGGGYYTIRPLHKINMGLNMSTFTTVDILDIGSTESQAAVANTAEWRIRYENGKYTFTNRAYSSRVMSVENSSVALEAQAVGTTPSSTNTSQQWILEMCSSRPILPVIYDSVTKHPVVSKFFALEECRTLEDMDILVECCIGNHRHTETLTWFTTTSATTSVNSTTGKVSALGSGLGTIGVKMVYGSTTAYDYYTADVMPIAETTYLLQNKQTGQYARGATIANNQQAYQGEFTGYEVQRWNFEHLGDGYFSIRLVASSTENLYLGVINDSTANNVNVVLRNTCSTYGTQWKVEVTQSGAYKLTAKTGRNTDYVLCTSSSNTSNNVKLIQSDYILSDSYQDEWYLFRIDLHYLYLELMYDTGYRRVTINPDPSLYSVAHIIREKFWDEFGIFIDYGQPVHCISYADSCNNLLLHRHCSCSAADDCANSAVENGVVSLEDLHHTNFYNVFCRLPRPDTSNCLRMIALGYPLCSVNEDTGEHDITINGLAYMPWGLGAVQTGTDETLSDMTFLHEFGHLLGAPDHYGGNTPSTGYMNAHSNYTFSQNCIYGENRNENNMTICAGCLAYMEENIDLYSHWNTSDEQGD